MAQTFAAIPVRANGDKVDYGWWNILRSAGITLENFISTLSIAWTSFTFANNQSSAAAVTGAAFDSASVTMVKVEIALRRKTTLMRQNAWVDLVLSWDTTALTWEIVDEVVRGDAAGMTWSIVTTGTSGQLKYISDNMSSGASYTGVSKYRATAI